LGGWAYLREIEYAKTNPSTMEWVAFQAGENTREIKSEFMGGYGVGGIMKSNVNKKVNAYTIALSGGKHSGWLKNMEKLSKKEIEKLERMSLKLLGKHLEGIILEEIFNKKNQELNQQIYSQKEKLYSLENLHNYQLLLFLHYG